MLADAVSDLLPREFLARKKMGFTLPFEKWMRSRLKSELASVFNSKEGLHAAGLNARGVETLWHAFLKTPSAIGWSRPWSLYVLAKWCEVNGVHA